MSGRGSRRGPRWLGAVVVAAALAGAGTVRAAPITEVHYTMGTYFSISLDGADESAARALMRRCFTETRRLEAIFSRYDQASELSRLNADHTTATVELSPDMADLLHRGLALRAATGGTFDVTIGALTALWRDADHWPSEDELRQAGAGDRGGRVRFEDARLASLAPGVLLDFDGFAKGYAVDRCVRILRDGGVHRALVSLGESSQYALGAPVGEDGWPVTVRTLEGDRALGTLRLRDQAISVSAVFGHERTIDGRRVGHIVDPRSGQPLTQAAMVVVVTRSATDAEAFSKALLIAETPLPIGSFSPLAGDPAGAPSGALIIRPSGVQQIGRLVFTPFVSAPVIAAEAEPIR